MLHLEPTRKRQKKAKKSSLGISDIVQEDFIGMKKEWWYSSILLLCFESIFRVTPTFKYNKNITNTDKKHTKN